jgi:mannose-1-phosphate guanylyltransferase/mannose-6-phosphate isomerase
MTLRRFARRGYAAPLVMTGDAFRFMATDQAAEIGLSDARVVVEPVGRDTAPAILTAALMLEETPDALMLVAPSDHVITDPAAFHAAVKKGAEAARTGAFVTFGITPDRPETGYGYLELARRPQDGAAVPLKSFREKPDLATAQAMLAAGGYLWNAGIFLMRVADLIAAFETHAPDLMAPCRAAIAEGAEDLGFLPAGAEAYGRRARSRSITRSWNAPTASWRCRSMAAGPIWAPGTRCGRPPGPDARATPPIGPVTAIDCRDSYLRSESEGMQLVGLGLEGIVAVAMPDAVLVADKSRAQDVKAVVDTLRRRASRRPTIIPAFTGPGAGTRRCASTPASR